MELEKCCCGSRPATKCTKAECGDYANYQTEFTVDQIKRLEEIRTQLQSTMTDEHKLVQEREDILRKAGTKRFNELWAKYVGKAVYSSNSDFYGRIIGIETGYDGSLRIIRCRGFYQRMDIKPDEYHGGNKTLIDTLHFSIDDVELISDDTYNHEAEKYIKSLNDTIVTCLEDIRYGSTQSKQYDICITSSGLKDYPEDAFIPYHSTPTEYYSEECCCNDECKCVEPSNRF